MNKIFRRSILLLSISVMITLTMSGVVGAATVSSMKSDIEAYDIYRCYSDSGVIVDKISLDDYKSYESIFINGDAEMPLYGAASNNAKCKDIIGNLFSKKYSLPGDYKDKEAQLKFLGYTGNSDNKCVYFTLEMTANNNNLFGGTRPKANVRSKSICSNDGTVSSGSISTKGVNGEWFDEDGTLPSPDSQFNPISVNVAGDGVDVLVINENGGFEDQNFKFSNYGNFSELVNEMDAYINNHFVNGLVVRDNQVNPNMNGTFISKGVSERMGDGGSTEYVLSASRGGAGKSVGMIAAGNLQGKNYSSVSDVAFNKEKKRDLYEGYLLRDYYNVSKDCSSESKPSDEWEQTALREGGKVKACYVLATGDRAGTEVHGLNGEYFRGDSKTWRQIAQELWEDWKDEIGEDAKEETAANDENGDGHDDDCYNAGVDGISWIACPAITNLTYTAGGFDDVIDDMLQIKTEYYNTSSGAYEVWEVMRNIANVAVILILLVIIASQITGYGIDNYGIKKMLPKLIIMAILINLSFVLCELVVDLSNIVGVGLRDVFGAIGQNIGDGNGGRVNDWVDILIGIAGSVGAAAGTGITGAIAAAGVVSGPMIIVMVLVALLGVVASLVLFFAALGVRLMLVVICIGIAPLAAVCYILPNTKKLFDRWWNVFKTCLIIYPICGALLGMSELIKGIAWNTAGGDDPSGVAMKLVALIAPYLPFFLLPALLKGAIGALGNISGALNSIGDRVRGAARSGGDAIRNTESYKDAMGEVAMKRQNRAAQRAIDRLKGKDNLTDSEKRRLGRARGTLIANADRMRRDSALSDDVAYSAAEIGLEKKADAESLANYMTLVNDRTRNGEDEGVLFSMYRQYMASNDKFGALAVARIAGRRKDTAARFMANEITGSAYKDKNGNFKSPEAKRDYDNMKSRNTQNNSIFRSVAKEISTGENARTYMGSTPLGFEYAAQVNRDGKLTADYDAWLSPDNIGKAVDNYITSSNELIGAKNSSLEELANYMESGKMKESDARTLQTLARDAIRKHEEHGGEWDVTKANSINRIANWGVTVPAGGLQVRSNPDQHRETYGAGGDTSYDGGGSYGGPVEGGF